MDQQQTIKAYNEAMQRERELWERVKGKQPGDPGFSQIIWNQWMEAVSRTNAASKALREAFSGDSKLGDVS